MSAAKDALLAWFGQQKRNLDPELLSRANEITVQLCEKNGVSFGGLVEDLSRKNVVKDHYGLRVVHMDGFKRSDDGSPVAKCVMLVQWPRRSGMVQEAITSFLKQKYPHKILIEVNDGEACSFTDHFCSNAHGVVVNLWKKTNIGQKRNVGAFCEASDIIVTMDDDDISLPKRLDEHVVCLRSALYHRPMMSVVAEHEIDNLRGLMHGQWFNCSAVRSSVVETIRWPDADYAEDFDFYNDIVRNMPEGSVCRSDRVSNICRRHSDNVSSKRENTSWYLDSSNLVEVDDKSILRFARRVRSEASLHPCLESLLPTAS